MKKTFLNLTYILIFNSFGFAALAQNDSPKECSEFLNSKITVIYNDQQKDVQALMGKAKAQYEEGNLSFTAEILKSIIKQRPDDYKAMGFLSQVYFRMGELTDALKYQQKAQSLEPTYRITTDLALAQILIGLKRFTEADVFLIRALNHEPNNNFATGLKARMYLDQNAFGNALPFIKRKLTLDPKDPNGRLYLAEYNFKKGFLNESLEIAYDLLKITPSEDMRIFKLQKRDIMGLALRAKTLSRFNHSPQDLQTALGDINILESNFTSTPVWLLYLRAEIEDKLSLPREMQKTLLRIVEKYKPNHQMALSGLVHLDKRGYALKDQTVIADAIKGLSHDELLYVLAWSQDFSWTSANTDNSPKNALTFAMDFWNGIHLIPLKY